MTQEERWAVWRKRLLCGKNTVLQEYQAYFRPEILITCLGIFTALELVSLSSLCLQCEKEAFLKCDLSALFQMSVLAQDELHIQSTSSSYLLTIKGVQDKILCSYLQKECLHVLRLIPFPISGFKVTNILFKLTSSVLWSIKLGLRLTQMIHTVSRYSGINQENCAYKWRPSYLFGVYRKNTVAFHVIHLVIVIKKGGKQHKHGKKEIHMDIFTHKHTVISLPS